MQIETVTITGADDNTDIDMMLNISRTFPVVEWGILISQSNAAESPDDATSRFPSIPWLKRLVKAAADNPDVLRTSIHVCGSWVQRICDGNWSDMLSGQQMGPVTIPAMDFVFETADRIQLNFHGYAHTVTKQSVLTLEKQPLGKPKQFIFQLDRLNDDLLEKAQLADVNAVGLFDLSHGGGALPAYWPKQPEGSYVGYSGGLGPDNIAQQLKQIAYVATGNIWIDMETKVRTDQRLDMAKVEKVLELVEASGYCNGPI